MNRTLRFAIGLALVLAVLIGGGYVVMQQLDRSPTAKAVTVSCVGGSEKTQFMRDSEVVAILADDYGITVHWSAMGSYDQVLMSGSEIKAREVNCLWPSSGSARNVFEAQRAATFPEYRAETLLQSPEVLYAGPTGTDALVRAGLVVRNGHLYSMPDLRRFLLDFQVPGRTWEEIGAAGLKGPMSISSTDPVRSNSGFTLAQLQLIMVATPDARQPTIDQARAALPTMRGIYDAQGLQAATSEYGFQQWLTQGGEYASPLFAGYENQIIQQVTNGANGDRFLTDVRMIYPEPTIYSDHPMLALDADAGRLLEAMKDERIQRIAWQRFGFRSAINSDWSRVGDFDPLPLATRFPVVSAPSSEVTLALLTCLQDRSQCR